MDYVVKVYGTGADIYEYGYTCLKHALEHKQGETLPCVIYEWDNVHKWWRLTEY